MTEAQKNKCRDIIEQHATYIAATNTAWLIPGFSKSIDLAGMTEMTNDLAVVFGATITQEVAKVLVADALGKAYLKHYEKATLKEVLNKIYGTQMSGNGRKVE